MHLSNKKHENTEKNHAEDQNIRQFRHRWIVYQIRHDQGYMKKILIAKRFTRWGARRAMWQAYKLECLEYPVGWSLIKRTRQADRCELRFKKENGKLARSEIFLRRA